MAEGGDSNSSLVSWLCGCIHRNQRGNHQRHIIPGQINVDLADWTNQSDSKSLHKRSDICRAIVHNQNTDELRTILETSWDVNERLRKKCDLNPSTCLHEACRQGWTEGVRVLCEAGAKYMPNITYTPETPLLLALQHQNCSVDIIELLLKHGAGPKLCERDSPCLGQAIIGMEYSDNFTKIARLLLENGADPNVPINNHIQTNLYRGPPCPLALVLLVFVKSASRIFREGTNDTSINEDEIKQLKMNALKKKNAEMFRILVLSGADVNRILDKTRSLPHELVVPILRINLNGPYYKGLFLQEHLDIFYKHGGNISMEYGGHGTALKYTVRNQGHCNSVRWLIRHGATIDVSLINLFEPSIYQQRCFKYKIFEDTLLILMVAGLRVSHGTHAHLINLEEEIVLGRASRNNFAFNQAVIDIVASLKKEDKEYNHERKLQKSNFAKYWSTQMVDLEEFSDESLHIYPEVTEDGGRKYELPFSLEQILTVLEFLSQPQSLQWHCRCSIRESLVSLQPSVVKTLPVPARLKRYILCHEL